MRARIWAVVGIAIAGAQAGHLLTYTLRFGAAAQHLQSSGVHGYFPALAKLAVGTAALAGIGALLIIAAARVVAQGHRRPAAAGGPSYITLLAALFTLQLACFVGQEVVESLVAGVAPPGAADLLLWGMLGQLPVAVAGTTVLRWFGRRVQAAVADLGNAVTVAAPLIFTAPLACRPVIAGTALAATHSARATAVKRGPPHSSAFRPF
ncbi:MAG TPA: hypothetical protein VFB69_00450 [Candidatus Dormibacteraeota bacterium]|nr:hypothetical protein [Candidatus Dormibacteraeota bacterium]